MGKTTTWDIAQKYSLPAPAFENFVLSTASIKTSGISNTFIEDDKIERAVALFKMTSEERKEFLEKEKRGEDVKNMQMSALASTVSGMNSNETNDMQESALKRMADRMKYQGSYSFASGVDYHYVVLQVTLKEKFIGTGSGNLSELENVINNQAKKGYRLHTITTANGGSKGLAGGDRIQATMVFEKIEPRE